MVDTRADDATPSAPRGAPRTLPEPPNTAPDGDDAAERGPGAMPRTIGRYRVLGVIGSGGMGVVLRAEDPQLGRMVAIKLVRPERTRDAAATEHRARLLREARALAALSHPNVVPVYDVGECDEGLFIAMQLVEGHDMRTWLGREKPGWRRILGVLRAAGRGLSAAHGAGMVHRDFKPANVLVGDDGRVRVVDFGLARAHREAADAASNGVARLDGVTAAGVLVGTPAYMAPEQFHGAPSDPRADQYAFCTAMYEAFYGALPFVADDLRSLLAKKRTGKVPEPPARAGAEEVPSDLLDVIRRGLSPDPAERFGSMPDVLRELRRIGEREEPTADGSHARASGHGSMFWIMATVALVAIAVVLGTCGAGG